MHEAGVAVKRKEVYSGATQPGRTADSHLKDHPHPPVQARSSHLLFSLRKWLSSCYQTCILSLLIMLIFSYTKNKTKKA